ncbi:hypothetical protein OG791_45705 [Streptomyces canus]
MGQHRRRHRRHAPRRSRPQPLRQRPQRPHRRTVHPQRDLPQTLGRPQNRRHRTGAKKLHHPVVGDLELHFETMTLTSDPGLTLVIYTATPNTPSADALRLLATWAATQDQPAPDLHDHRP